jgi:hypothetical protein
MNPVQAARAFARRGASASGVLGVLAIGLLFAGACRDDSPSPSSGPLEIPGERYIESTAPIISIGRSYVLLEGTLVARLDRDDAGGRMEALYAGLLESRRRFSQRMPATPFDGEYVLQVAPDAPWGLVTRVQATAVEAGYSRPALAHNRTRER